MTELTLRYHGAAAANIKVYKKDRPEPEKLLFEGMVDPGEDFDFVGNDNHGTMGSKITVWIDDVLNTEIHTSCSQPISVGMVSGDFEIMAGVSRHGGPLCPPPCDDYGDNDDGCRENECWGRLTGPITDMNFRTDTSKSWAPRSISIRDDDDDKGGNHDDCDHGDWEHVAVPGRCRSRCGHVMTATSSPAATPGARTATRGEGLRAAGNPQRRGLHQGRGRPEHRGEPRHVIAEFVINPR